MEADSNVIHCGRYKYHSKTVRSCNRIVIGWGKNNAIRVLQGEGHY